MNKIAQRIVAEIIEDLSDRRGLRHQWEQIDEDIQEEIIQVWTAIVTKHLDATK